MSWQVDKLTSKRTIELFKGEPLLLVVLLYIYGGITKQIVLIARSTPLHYAPHGSPLNRTLTRNTNKTHVLQHACHTGVACYALNP